MAHSDQTNDGKKSVTIKKYANRRLYNTATSSYVTLDHLCQMVKEDVDFVVYDAKTGDDITRSVLTQIIVEEESKGTNLLPIAFLRQLIGFYGHSMQGLVPNYLDQMMDAFAANQDRLRQQMQETMSGIFPFSPNLEEMGRQNAALMESAMKMFTPFGPGQGQGQGQGQGRSQNAPGESASTGENGERDTGEGSKTPPPPGAPATMEDAESLALLQAQIRQLQDRIDALSSEDQDPAADTSPGTNVQGETPSAHASEASPEDAKNVGTGQKGGGKSAHPKSAPNE